MLKGIILLTLSLFLIGFAQCEDSQSDKGLSPSKKAKKQVEDKSYEVPAKLDEPGLSDDLSKKLDEAITRIDSLAEDVTSIKERMNKLEGKKAKPKEKVTLKTLDKRVTQLEKTKYRSRHLIRRLYKSRYLGRYKSKYGHYRIYVGAFESYNNAVNRKKHVDRLGIAVRIHGNKSWRLTRREANRYRPIYERDYEYDGAQRQLSVRATDSYYNGRRWGRLYKIISHRRYSFRNAVRLSNYLISRGYNAYIRRAG
ncbi:MAG TPA: hypothetical protein ENI73_03095 [Spirochaetes bacterium]|nr:hypothetical protein [Spirochaetota bacterium]